MSEDLRRLAVEAMARAATEADLDTYDEYDQRLTREMAADMLDALLDILADNAEAWAVDPFEVFVAGDGYNSIRPRDGVDVVNQVIDALRSNSKGDGQE